MELTTTKCWCTMYLLQFDKYQSQHLQYLTRYWLESNYMCLVKIYRYVMNNISKRSNSTVLYRIVKQLDMRRALEWCLKDITFLLLLWPCKRAQKEGTWFFQIFRKFIPLLFWALLQGCFLGFLRKFIATSKVFWGRVKKIMKISIIIICQKLYYISKVILYVKSYILWDF